MSRSSQHWYSDLFQPLPLTEQAPESYSLFPKVVPDNSLNVLHHKKGPKLPNLQYLPPDDQH